ncbi:hypothetical protein K431DRAFT_70112 [Polychaeton citri CBS 116435]|uniref:HAUS augmin-like complex subunit 3 N-terminal domain-containing protein n=1 Tax=Polychaeton citri CBS 116435 TaxID=1314669 RepID=A0A9P4Q7V9_9PEZI|nr:hypothetical protein K431DRAFT_70112 [Polychaeton citri CBS 116435]
MSPKELFRLLNILDQRDIGLSKEDVAPAFQASDISEKTERWMQEFLGDATLLTREELTFFENHDANDLEVRSGAHPVSDAELKAAMISIEASTAAIEQQTQRLQAQKRALFQLRNSHQEPDVLASNRTNRTQRIQREKAKLDLEVSELSQDLDAGLQESLKQRDASLKSLSSNIERSLEKDDRLLDELSKLVPRIIDHNVSGANKVSIDQVNQLCEVLTRFAQLEVQHRVDNVYCTALAYHTQSSVPDPGRTGKVDKSEVSSEMSIMRSELAELTGEIPSILSVAIDSQYRTPLVRKMEASQSQAELERARWGDYLISTLEYLASRLDVIGEHFCGQKAHRDALTSIADCLKPELISLHELAKNSASAQRQMLKSPAKDSRKGLRPLMLLSRSHDGQDPALSLIHHLGITNVDGMDDVNLTKALKAAIAEGRERQASLANSTDNGMTRMLSDSLARGDKDVEDLLSAVHTYSPFATLETMDGTVRAGLDSLQDKTQSLGLAVRQLDTDGTSRDIRARQRDLQALWQD